MPTLDEASAAAQVTVSQSNAILLARIDERTIATDRVVQEIKVLVTTNYVTQQEFKPVRALVYGAVGLMLTGIIGAIIALVVLLPKH